MLAACDVVARKEMAIESILIFFIVSLVTQLLSLTN